jgi:ribosomal protein S18 acetylase RimI-like enzyme
MSEGFRPVRDDEIDDVVALWENSAMTRPWNPPHADIAAIRANANSALLVALSGGKLAATVAIENGGHRAWVYYLCSAAELRGQGWGRRAMEAAEAWAHKHGQTKIQLLVRRSNKQVRTFYDVLGYEESGVVVLQKWIDPEREQAFRENPDVH